MTAYKLTSSRSDYMTPRELIDKILYEENAEKFDIDVCCSEENIPAKRYYKAVVNIETGEVIEVLNDGLKLDWGKLNWCNPPYKVARNWVKKAIREAEKGNTTWMLIPFRPETVWWDFVLNEVGTLKNRVFENSKYKCIFLKKGLCFVDPVTKNEMQVYKNPLALVKFKGVKNEQ